MAVGVREPWDAGEIKLVLGGFLLVLIWLASVALLRRWRGQEKL